MNKTCGDCKFFYDYEHRVHPCVWGAPWDEACHDFEPKVITNGDKIRQGGDKELVIYKKQWDCDICAYYKAGCKRPKDKMCIDGMLAWLNAPAESEGKDENNIND